MSYKDKLESQYIYEQEVVEVMSLESMRFISILFIVIFGALIIYYLFQYGLGCAMDDSSKKSQAYLIMPCFIAFAIAMIVKSDLETELDKPNDFLFYKEIIENSDEDYSDLKLGWNKWLYDEQQRILKDGVKDSYDKKIAELTPIE